MARSTGKVSDVVRTKSCDKVASPDKPKYSTRSVTGKRKRADNHANTSPADTPVVKCSQSKAEQEKRLKPFRNHPPQTFLQKLGRAQSQRMVVVGRTRTGSGGELSEKIDIVGTTGNIYEVTIAKLPKCTCPDHLKGNECKHKVYALHTVLRAPEALQYQRAFLTSELDEIFANAPPIPADAGESENSNGKRKPVEGECPICYMDFDEENNELTWCKAACGNNMHKSCFEQWVASQRGQVPRCVYCRAEWQMGNEDLGKILESGVVGDGGYVNVAEHFGISRARDYSTYHAPWVRRRFGGY